MSGLIGRPAVRVLVAVALAAMAVRCARSLDELIPFACAGDNSCPNGLACVPGVGCTYAALDSLCTMGTSCGMAADGAYCTAYGTCSQPCDAGCGAGRVCGLAGDDVCVPECGDGGACPSGFGCRDLRHDGATGCVPGAVPYARCTGASVLTNITCGQANMVTVCPSGSRCPAYAVCDPPGFCTCPSGYSLLGCDGLPCSGGACTWPNYFCAPFDVNRSCAASSGWGQANYSCSDGRESTTWCGGSQGGCESFCAADGGCDVVVQNCGAGEKCELQGTRGVCVTPTGALTEGEACTPAGSHDDCAAGLSCVIGQHPSGGGACARFCSPSRPCPGGATICLWTRTEPDVGFCGQPCQLFDGTCAPGMTCSMNASITYENYGYCRAIGSKALGDACANDIECPQDSTCAGTCRANCDSTHACAIGTCGKWYGNFLQNGAGACSG